MKYTYRGLRRPISEKVAVTAPGQGFTTRVVGYETFDVELEIDVDGIARDLGLAAARNRSGKSIGLSGLVKVKATNRKREK